MPKKGFAFIPLAIIAAILLAVLAVFLLKPSKGTSRLDKALNKAKSKVSQSVQGDLIDGYPHECEKRMGFDNWRTFQSLAVDPTDSKTSYVAVEYKGVYKSQDGGKTWSAKNKGLRGYPSRNNELVPCQEQHPLLEIDPANSDRLILTSASSPGTLKDINSENGGVYESVDGGESWHQLFDEKMNAWTYAAFAFDPNDTKTFYVGTSAMPASSDEADPNKIFVTKGVLYKTEDGGKNWSELATGLVPYLRSGKLFIDPNDANHLILTTMALPPNKGGGQVAGEQLGILESRDGGESWKTLANEGAIGHADIAKQNFNNIFIAVQKSNENEVKYYSSDGGKTFSQAQTIVNLFRFDPHDPKGLRLLGYNLFTQSRSIFESLDGGKTWNQFSSIPKEVTSEDRISNIVWDPVNKDVVYLNGDHGRVWKSEDNGKTWNLILSLEMLNSN